MTARIALVGPGAIGSTVATLLHAAGHRLVLCGHTARESIELRLTAIPVSTGRSWCPGR